MDPLRLFLLDHGFPVEYELDKFNTPHTGTTLRHPQNWLCRLRCRIPLRHLAASPLGNIFWRHSRFSPKQPEPQTHSDFNISLLKQQTRLLLHYREHISLAHPTTRARRMLEWRIWSRWREINTQVFCEPGLVRKCLSNQQHNFAVWCFGHHATSWDVALVSPFNK